MSRYHRHLARTRRIQRERRILDALDFAGAARRLGDSLRALAREMPPWWPRSHYGAVEGCRTIHDGTLVFDDGPHYTVELLPGDVVWSGPETFRLPAAVD